MSVHRRLTVLASLSLGLLAAPIPAFADIVHLKSGGKLEGSIKKTEDGYDVTLPNGTVRKVSPAEVKSVELKTSAAPDEVQRRFDSLKRSTDNVSDPKIAVVRYKDFIAKTPADVPSVADAKRELALWQDRLDKKRVKVGDRWLTASEVGKIQEESLAAAIHARRLLRQGKLKEAGPILEQAIKDDPKNASAHYLRGVMFFRQEQLGQAKKAFETAASLVQDHGATLNNLAVVLWRQNAFTGAINMYDAALVATPMEPVILNNVAEALNALPRGDRESGAVKKLVRHFQEQDEALAQAMKKEGRYRWGSTWVTAAELDKLQSKEKEIKDKIDALEQQYSTAKEQLAQLENEINDTKRAIRRLEADSYTVDASGRPVRRVIPPVYYQLKHDLQDLAREYQDAEGELDRLRREAKKVKQDLPTPRYTGIQRIIEAEGTPLLPRNDPEDADAAATAPATGPAAAPAAGLRRNPDEVPVVPPPPPLEPGPPYRPK
jgi:tetratricopeptide (TPR) repeat protein